MDPKGKAPCSWTFHMQEFASDERATVRIRHLPLSSGNGTKSAWEIHVAPQGINKTSGAVSSATYSMLVLTDGTQTEFVGGNRTIEIEGDDVLKVSGKRATTISGNDNLEVGGSLQLKARGEASIEGKKTSLGGVGAIEPTMLGNAFMQWFGTVVFDVKGLVATPNPSALISLQKVMSRKVFSK
jgi:hypothetical protein